MKYLRRLAPLGIEGNEPAIKAYCKITPEEKQIIIEAILQQKVGANAKNFKQFVSFKIKTNKTNEMEAK